MSKTRNEIGIRFGALAAPIATQLEQQGMTGDAERLQALEEDATAIARLYIRSLITETENRRACKRLLKDIIRAARPVEPEPATNR